MGFKQFTVVIFIGLAAGADAQNIPDAGALLRQIEQNNRQNQFPPNWQKREALPPAMVFGADTIVRVQHFKFNGNKILNDEQLQSVVAPFTDRPLDSHDLQMLTRVLSDAYRQTGWLVQAYIPRQVINNSEMTVQVIESMPPSKPSQ
jgi:hemolysin activation/secretion protein